MLNDSVNSTADHEARNACLIEIDEAWELCRDTIDLARIALEESLESARADFEGSRKRLDEEHQTGLEDAWNAYRETISESPVPNRRDRIAAASTAYKRAAESTREEFRAHLAAVLEQYTSARHAARAAYEDAVEGAYALHREVLEQTRAYFEGGVGEVPASMLNEDGMPAGDSGESSGFGQAADEGSGTSSDYGNLFVEFQP